MLEETRVVGENHRTAVSDKLYHTMFNRVHFALR